MLALSCVDTLLACAANLLPASRAESARFFRLNALLNAMTSARKGELLGSGAVKGVPAHAAQ